MRTILSGRITRQHLADADLLAGISPTMFVTNGLSDPPAGTGVPHIVMACCSKIGGAAAERARDFTLVQSADALICVGENEHLVDLAEMYGLTVHYEP